jgi:hypothetical protein
VVPGSLLQATLEELQELSDQTFLLVLQSQVKQQLSEHIDAPPSDLSPSPSVSKLLKLLREVLSVGSVAERRQQDLTKVRGKGLCAIFELQNTLDYTYADNPVCGLSVLFLVLFGTVWSGHYVH